MATKNKLIRRIRREISASPKKAAILGVSLVVAIWFWAPLVGKWFGSKTPGDDAAVTPANIEETATNSTTLPVTATKTAMPKWHQVLEWIRKDPLTEPYTPEAGERDPFSPSASQIARQEEEQPPNEPAPELTPAQAGLALRSTVVGPRNKTALINGRAYHEKQSVLATNGRDRFLLLEIHDNRIILERHGRSFEVKLPRLEATSTDE